MRSGVLILGSEMASVIKRMRIAMLLPVILVAATITCRLAAKDGSAEAGERPPLLPWFAVGFVILAAINSTGWLPKGIVSAGNDLSRWCLVIAISALGMKTQLKEVATVGLKPVLLMIGETIFLAALVLVALRWFI